MKHFEPNKHYTKQEVINYMITYKHDGKMEGMLSLSTSVLLNIECANKKRFANLICHDCYAESLLNQRKNLSDKTAFNTAVLTRMLFKKEDFPLLNCLYFRFESFADLNNEIQAENYIRMCKRNPKVNFALWTKNPWILFNALMRYENGMKPKNLQVVYSSPEKNRIASWILKMYILPNGKSMIDKVFTVFDAVFAIEHDIEINCGWRKCLTCGKCYERNKIQFMNEILKSELVKYMKMKAKQEGRETK